MRYRVIITNEEDEVIETSEEPVGAKDLHSEARSVAESAFRIILAREHLKVDFDAGS